MSTFKVEADPGFISESQSSELVAKNLLSFVGSQNEGVISSEQLQAMSVLLGAKAVTDSVLRLRVEEEAAIDFNGELQISQVRLWSEAGRTALRAISEPETKPTAATHAEEIAEGTSAVAAPEMKDDPAATQDLSKLGLSGVPARVAIVNYLASLPDGLLDKGGSRSAGSVLVDKLAPFGHTPVAVRQASKSLLKKGLLSQIKPTPTAKIVNSFQLTEDAKKKS